MGLRVEMRLQGGGGPEAGCGEPGREVGPLEASGASVVVGGV